MRSLYSSRILFLSLCAHFSNLPFFLSESVCTNARQLKSKRCLRYGFILDRMLSGIIRSRLLLVGGLFRMKHAVFMASAHNHFELSSTIKNLVLARSAKVRFRCAALLQDFKKYVVVALFAISFLWRPVLKVMPDARTLSIWAESFYGISANEQYVF